MLSVKIAKLAGKGKETKAYLAVPSHSSKLYIHTTSRPLENTAPCRPRILRKRPKWDTCQKCQGDTMEKKEYQALLV